MGSAFSSCQWPLAALGPTGRERLGARPRGVHDEPTRDDNGDAMAALTPIAEQAHATDAHTTTATQAQDSLVLDTITLICHRRLNR